MLSSSDVAALAGSSGSGGAVGWREALHWMWPLYSERWGPWRYHRLGLSAVPYSDRAASLPPPPPLLYGGCPLPCLLGC